MTMVAVSQVKLGDKLLQDVSTPLGSILFYKGRVITPRELEILRAFLVPTVVIDSGDSADHGAEQVKAEIAKKGAKANLLTQYTQMVQLLKSVFSQSIIGMNVPIVEIRAQLEAMLQHIEEYNLLSFSPMLQENEQEDYLYHKSVMTSMSCYMLAQWVGLSKKDWIPAALAGLLHDIGNTKVDQSILNKPASLTQSEIDEMKRHPLTGYQLLKNVAAINDGVKLAALQHHERIDGSGYPLGVTMDKIHPYAKLVAIADIYNAMTMKRAYRQAASPYLVLEQLQQDAFGKLDPSYVTAFVEKATQFHNGTLVRLNDDRVGEIIFTDPAHPTRPWVSIGGDIINLTTERQVYIAEILTNNTTTK
ncbi:HD-GYP domain-containing protein [Paenibacillus sp. GCM10027626]|uniref:HD-GYP domain-containing protein n=1 Tax=Paenibacillus sp. GCM10027626 TaxID=3273411 RepID=UPI003632DBBC